MVAEIQEKRKFPRAAYPCKIMVDSPQRQLSSHTENIGTGGIRVNLEEELAPLATVGIILFLHQDKPMRCEGQVKWVIKKVNPMMGKPTLFFTGIEFTSISSTHKDHISKTVERLLSE